MLMNLCIGDGQRFLSCSHGALFVYDINVTSLDYLRGGIVARPIRET